jgi:hypothetical protein
MIRSHVLLAVAASALMANTVQAQRLGAFQWQLQPYCNVVTVEVTMVGGVYGLDGSDDQCGTERRAAVIGTAVLAADGTVSMGLVGVTAPGGSVVGTQATISLASLSGTWRDGTGASGPFVPVSGGPRAGTPRPRLASGRPITVAQVGGGLAGTRVDRTLSLSLALGADGSESVPARADHTHRQAEATSTAVGAFALEEGSTSVNSTAVGIQALRNIVSGRQNTGVGARALLDNIGSDANLALGVDALANLAVGTANVAVGRRAMANGSGASSNVAVGEGALLASAGADNVGVGSHALSGIGTGSGNIAIGTFAGSDTSAPGANNIHIGNDGAALDMNTIRIGDANHVGTVIGGIAGRQSVGGVPLLIGPDGRLGTVMSSARTKDNIASLGGVAGRLARLTPVQFTYTPDAGGDPSEVQFGLVAEDVAAVFPELAVHDAEGRPWGVRYHLLVPLLLGEVQRLQRELTALESLEQEYTRRLEATEAQRSTPQR